MGTSCISARACRIGFGKTHRSTLCCKPRAGLRVGSGWRHLTSLVWLRIVEGARPDRWDLVGATICVVGALVIVSVAALSALAWSTGDQAHEAARNTTRLGVHKTGTSPSTACGPSRFLQRYQWEGRASGRKCRRTNNNTMPIAMMPTRYVQRAGVSESTAVAVDTKVAGETACR